MHLLSFLVVATLIKLSPLQVSTRLVALKDNCIHPTSNNPYIKSASGGTDNSPEGFQVRSGPSMNNNILSALVVNWQLTKTKGRYNARVRR